MLVDKLTAGSAGNIHTKGDVGAVIGETETPGFGVLIGKTGRAYIIRFRVRGKSTQYTRRIGDIDEIGLADARAEAVRVKGMAKGNRALRIPPRHPDQDEWDREAAARAEAEAAEIKAVEVAKAATETFLAVATTYLDDTLKDGGGGLKSNDELRRKLTKDLQAWHDLQISEIDTKAIDERVRQKARGHGVAANRLLAFIKTTFAYAKRRHLIAVNPALDVVKPFDERARERFLDENEIRILWAACGKLPEPIGRLYRLLLVLGQRRGEVAGMLRSEMTTIPLRERDRATGREKVIAHQRVWKLGEDRTKNGKAHTVPLPDLAQRLIDEAPASNYDHLLASGAAEDTPVSGWSKYRRYLDKAIAEVMAENEADYADADPRPFAAAWHVHDLRASVATFLEAELMIPEHIIARVLNHSPGGAKKTMTRRYIRNPYDREAAEALQAWADHLKQIVGENILPFEEKRA